jgi:hypothetical protein
MTSRARPASDPRPFIYAGLDLLFGVVYAYVVAALIPNRLLSAKIHLWSLPVCALGMAVGMFGILVARHRKLAWRVALVASSLLLASGVLLILRIIVSAAFLAGVYGGFGQMAAMGGYMAAALVVELVLLLPLVQVKYLMSRAGKRTFGVS